MKNSEVLKAAKDIISDHHKWSVGDYAYNANGDSVDATSPDAVCFCSLGAVRRATNVNMDHHDCLKYLSEAGTELYNSSFIDEINDAETHQGVMKMWDKAIELAEKAGD